MKIYLDIETRSRVDLRKSNVYRYAADPDFRILMMAYAVDDGPVELVLDESDMRRLVEQWTGGGYRIIAQNSSFERVCFSRLLELPPGTYLDPELFDDPMPLAAEHGFPMKLESMARWLGGEQKDEAGVAEKKQMDALRTTLEESGVSFTLVQHLRGNDAAEELLAVAEDNQDVTMIVIGSRRRSPVGKLIMGSTGQRVILGATVPVVAVKGS